MPRKQKDKDEIDEGRLGPNEAVQHGISTGVNLLREAYGLDIDPDIFSGYLNQEQIHGEIARIGKTRKYRAGDAEQRAESLARGIAEYIIKKKPFNEGGIKLLKGLESIVERPGWLKQIFSSRGEISEKKWQEIDKYLHSRGEAKKISYAVAKNQELYARDAPELLEAVSELERTSGRGSIADILYSSGDLAKKYYQNIKTAIKNSSERVLDLAGKYVTSPLEEMAGNYAPHPAVAGAMVIVGVGLVLFFNSMKMSGAVVGVSLGTSSIPSIIGLVLLIFGLIGLTFHKK